jgi:DNA invertase Pin-like site-specific DNA recombinase
MGRRIAGESNDASEAAPRAALYARVSTGRQAEQDLSIPDQSAQMKAWCEARQIKVAACYVEPGASATDDKRAEFQRMIERTCDGEHAFDLIVVHSYSRFFRDAFGLEFYMRKLAKQGVKLVSITQELGEDPAQVMMRQVIALFDEYQSKENAKHVLRAMKENARQGFWNGARPPFGYRTVEAERRGARIKKKLVVDDVEAETVRLIFKLFLRGDQGSGPMGVKCIVNWLNVRGYRTRGGARWGLGPAHTLLTNPVYAGQMRFNLVEARSGRLKAEAEHVTAEIPAIIESTVFDEVQRLLKERNPRVTPPRVVNGPNLLTGLAFCASCNGAMTLKTGTSKSGKVHRYYSCSTCARLGKTACEGRAIAVDRLDGLVTGALVERLLHPERISVLLCAIAEKRANEAAAVNDRIGRLEREAQDAGERLTRLYRLVEDGVAELDDLLKERIASLKADRERTHIALERARSASRSKIQISSVLIESFSKTMREKMTGGEIPFRKAYIGAIVDRIEVDTDTVRIIGQKDALEHGVMHHSAPSFGVRSFVRKWRSLGESNALLHPTTADHIVPLTRKSARQPVTHCKNYEKMAGDAFWGSAIPAKVIGRKPCSP